MKRIHDFLESGLHLLGVAFHVLLGAMLIFYIFFCIINICLGNYHRPGDNFEAFAAVRDYCEAAHIEISAWSEIRQTLYAFQGRPHGYLIEPDGILFVDDGSEMPAGIYIEWNGNYTIYDKLTIKDTPAAMSSGGIFYTLGGSMSIHSVSQIPRV